MKIWDYIKSKKNKSNSNDFLTEQYANIAASSISKINGKDSPMNNIEGCHSKEFVRMSGDYFQDLYDELRNNPNCSYRSYMNDVIKSGYDPKHLSVLVKLVEEHIFGAYTEVLSSRIANFMGAPTVYNKCYTDEIGDNYVISVDFMKPEYRMVDIIKLANDFYSEITHESAYAFDKDYVSWRSFFMGISQMFGGKLCGSDTNSTDFEDEFFKYYFTRMHILRDADFDLHNVGLLTNDKGRIELEPMYDTEFAFCNDNIYTNRFLVKDMQKILKCQPLKLIACADRFKELMKKGNLKKLFEGIDNPKFKKKAINDLKNSFEAFEYNYYLANQYNKMEERSR